MQESHHLRTDTVTTIVGLRRVDEAHLACRASSSSRRTANITFLGDRKGKRTKSPGDYIEEHFACMRYWRNIPVVLILCFVFFVMDHPDGSIFRLPRNRAVAFRRIERSWLNPRFNILAGSLSVSPIFEFARAPEHYCSLSFR